MPSQKKYRRSGYTFSDEETSYSQTGVREHSVWEPAVSQHTIIGWVTFEGGHTSPHSSLSGLQDCLLRTVKEYAPPSGEDLRVNGSLRPGENSPQSGTQEVLAHYSGGG